MKNILSILVAVIGVAAIVFGVLFMMEAKDARTTLEAELAPVTLETLDATYDQVKGGLAQAQAAVAAATDPAIKAATNETVQNLGWQKASLSVAKANAGTIDFVEKSGILMIILGAGFVLTGGALMMKKS